MGAVHVLFFAAVRDAVGCEGVEIRWAGEERLSADAFWARLAGEYPALTPFRAKVRLARNREYLGAGEFIHSGDEVALIPPVSGG